MNKRNTRAFALGILFSVSMIGIIYFSVDDKKTVELNAENAKAMLESEGYIVLTKDKYNKMEKTITEATKQVKKTKPPQEEKPEVSEEKVDKVEKVDKTTFKLEIITGTIPRDIALKLEKETIIDDANQFELYLEDNGLSKKIQLGTYELKAGMSYEEIAKIITKS